MAKRLKNPKTRASRKKTKPVGQPEGPSSTTSQTWTIAFPSESEESKFADFLATHTEEAKLYPSYRRDVTANPFFHPKRKRIEKLKGTSFPEDTHRWAKANLRVMYKPVPATRIIWNLEIGTATSIDYKKRSHR